MPAAKMGYCTIVARNYIPQALVLFESFAKCVHEVPFHMLVIDGGPEDVPFRDSRLLVDGLDALDLSERESTDLTAIYNVVEACTAVKPLYLLHMLEMYERAVYLDPDMYVVSALQELPDLVDRYGLVLTPHLLKPIPLGSSEISDANSLAAGVYNLGFCAVGRRASSFLSWWWSHLQYECLNYPLLGLFVDQKWVDLGAMLFEGYPFRHPGYNVGPWNLHERHFHIERINGESVYMMDGMDEELRVVHFSGFDRDGSLWVTDRDNRSSEMQDFPALEKLTMAYEQRLQSMRESAGCGKEYRFVVDSSGTRMSSHVRRAYRAARLSGKEVPSPFDARVAGAWRRWRRLSGFRQMMVALFDVGLCFKYAFPDLYLRFKERHPLLWAHMRSALLNRGKIRR